MNGQASPETESLRTQLAELNVRARAYTSQLWQIPFAYIGIVGVALAQVADKGPGVLAATFLCGGLFGTAVLIHMTAMLEGTKRAVAHILQVESGLGLEQTARYRPVWHIGPFIGIVLLAVVSSYIGAGYYWCQPLE